MKDAAEMGSNLTHNLTHGMSDWGRVRLVSKEERDDNIKFSQHNEIVALGGCATHVYDMPSN